MAVPKLLRLIHTMTTREFSFFLKVVRSGVFNRHQDLLHLADYLESCHPAFPDPGSFKTEAFRRLYGEAPYDDLRMRHLLSLAVDLAETSLVLPDWQQSLDKDLAIAGCYASRGLTKGQATALGKARRKLEKTGRDGLSPDHFHERFKVALSEQSVREPDHSGQPDSVFEELDRYFIANKLRQACINYSRQHIDQTEAPPPLLREVEAHLQSRSALSPLELLYSTAIATMGSASDVEAFQVFVQTLEEHQNRLSHETGAELHILARNFCIRRMNEGDRDFAGRLYHLYQVALRGKFIHDVQGHILPSAFKNIVTTGLKLGDLEGVAAFLRDHSGDLAPRHRPDYLLYGQGRLQFAAGNFRKVVHILREARYSSIFLELDCRILLARAWYELREPEVCLSLVESTFKLLRRRNLRSYHRESYLLTLHLLRALLLWSPDDERRILRLKASLERADLPDREWFREKFEEKD